MARYLATKSELRHRHGALIVKSGRVLGMGYNKRRNHPANVNPGRHRYDCGVHAEAAAIKDAGSNVRGATIFVARVNRHGEDLLSKPCPRCQDLIERMELKSVVHTW